MKERASKFITIIAMLTAIMSKANADDWGCEVLLCLSNPAGPTAVAQCVQPINKLWKALRKGKPYPSCDMGSSSGNGAEHQFASGINCPPQYRTYDDYTYKNPQPTGCEYSGAITIFSNGAPTERIWWNGIDTVVEPLTPGKENRDGAQKFQADYAAWKAKEEDKRQKQASKKKKKEQGEW